MDGGNGRVRLSTLAFGRRIGAAAGVVFVSVHILAAAGAADADEPVEGFILSGVTVTAKRQSAYAGAIYAPFGSMSGAGLRLRGWVEAGTLDGGALLDGRWQTKLDRAEVGFNAEIGTRFTLFRWALATYAGLAYRVRERTRPETDKVRAKEAVWPRLTVEAERDLPYSLGLRANGSYLFIGNEYWLQVRPHLRKEAGWRIGVDFALSGGRGYQRPRAGLFLSDLSLGFIGLDGTYASVEMGARFRSLMSSPGIYGGMHISRSF